MPDTPDLLIKDLIVTGDAGRQILHIPALDIAPGSRIGIRGPSGAGKSTLLHALAGLIAGAEGQVCWGDTNLITLPETARSTFRRQHIGMIFQDFLLFDELTAIENAGIAALYAPRHDRSALRDRATRELHNRALIDIKRSVAGYSGGERQRVAVARALAHDPASILADEPTASLDPATGEAMIAELATYARDRNKTLIAVSHDARLLEQMDQTLTIRDGRLA